MIVMLNLVCLIKPRDCLLVFLLVQRLRLLAWLLMQAVTGYALMTGEEPDLAPMREVF